MSNNKAIGIVVVVIMAALVWRVVIARNQKSLPSPNPYTIATPTPSPLQDTVPLPTCPDAKNCKG